jgi:hypothetical protein
VLSQSAGRLQFYSNQVEAAAAVASTLGDCHRAARFRHCPAICLRHSLISQTSSTMPWDPLIRTLNSSSHRDDHTDADLVAIKMIDRSAKIKSARQIALSSARSSVLTHKLARSNRPVARWHFSGRLQHSPHARAIPRQERPMKRCSHSFSPSHATLSAQSD